MQSRLGGAYCYHIPVLRKLNNNKKNPQSRVLIFRAPHDYFRGKGQKSVGQTVQCTFTTGKVFSLTVNTQAVLSELVPPDILQSRMI